MIYLIVFAVMVIWGFSGFALGYVLRGLDDGYDPDELWCGCDGAGMAHKAGAEGFACAQEEK